MAFNLKDKMAGMGKGGGGGKKSSSSKSKSKTAHKRSGSNSSSKSGGSPARSSTRSVAATPPRQSSSKDAGGSKFGFGRWGKKNADAGTAAPTPSPKSRRRMDEEADGDEGVEQEYQASKSKSFSKSKSKKGMSSRKASSYKSTDYDEAPAKSSGGLCGCKRLIMGTCCLALLAIVGVVVWRYGPWAKDDTEVESLKADTCPGCCNGSQSNCDKPVNEVLFPMVHHAHSSSANGFVGASNNRPFEEALVAGYRALRMSTCVCEGVLSKALLERDAAWGLGESNMGFCHTACGAGVRDPKDVLTNLVTFVETNPREVVILQIEMLDGSSADLRTALRYSGLLDYVYKSQEEFYIENWPTLQELIDAKTNVIVFASGDGMGSCKPVDCEDGILYDNDHILQTSTDGTELETCDAPIVGDVYVSYFAMNHFEVNKFQPPSAKKARDLNTFTNLKGRFADCEGKRSPGLLAVEFWDEGQVLEFVEDYNKGGVSGNEVEFEEAGEERRGLRG
ncbi:hypothetical protein ACHAXT_007641 [Thalassiosira profunda]